MTDKPSAEINSIEDLLDRVTEAARRSRGRISFEEVLKAIGRRSFGPLLLLAGLITLSPIGDIPGSSTLMAIVVSSIAIQVLMHRDHFWMPRWLLRRTVSQEGMLKATRVLLKPARFIDRMTHSRLKVFTTPGAVYVIAAVCLLIAVAMPPMELVPFSASGAGAALTAFGLAIVAHDGLVALFAFLATVGTLGAVVYKLV